MGNLTFIVPLKNEYDAEIDYVTDLLKEEFPELKFEKAFDDDQALIISDVYKTEGDFICALNFNKHCYILDDIESDKKWHREESGLSQEEIDTAIKELEMLERKNRKFEGCIQSSYGRNFEKKNDVDHFLKEYFGGFIFDEGIHPEFMGPSYKRASKKKKTKIQKFKNFLGVTDNPWDNWGKDAEK